MSRPRLLARKNRSAPATPAERELLDAIAAAKKVMVESVVNTSPNTYRLALVQLLDALGEKTPRCNCDAWIEDREPHAETCPCFAWQAKRQQTGT